MITDSHGPDLTAYVHPTDAIDCDSPAVIQFANDTSSGSRTDIDRAVALYHAVRDDFRYDPYRLDLTLQGMRASSTLAKGYGFCVPKAVLLAALARALHIPSRLGFADVKNHLVTKRLLELMQTDLFVFHGYTELYLEGKWVKATPAFNKSLCQRFDVEPLAFDGRNDSVLQQSDRKGNEFMQYVRDRGTFADLPLDELRAAFEQHYPSFMSSGNHDQTGVFEEEAPTQRER